MQFDCNEQLKSYNEQPYKTVAFLLFTINTAFHYEKSASCVKNIAFCVYSCYTKEKCLGRTMFDYFKLHYLDLRFGPSYILTEILFVITAVTLLTKFKKTKKCWITFGIALPAAFLFVILCNSLIQWIFGASHNRWVAYPLLLILYAVFFSKYKRRTKIIMVCLFYLNFLATMGISESLAYYIDEALALSQSYFAIILFAIFSIGSVSYLKFYALDSFKFVPLMCIGLAITFSAVGITVEVLHSFRIITPTRDYHLVVGLAFYIISVIMYALLHYICTEVQNNHALILKEKSREEEQKFVALSSQNLEELKKIRHELKNQYAYLKLLLEGGDTKKALDYFDSMEIRVLPTLTVINSENDTVNTVMNLERQKAKDKGINIDVRYAIPASIAIDSVDLTSVITNLVDNALEYVELHVPKGSITVDIYQKGKYLFINVENPVAEYADKEKLLRLKTTKLNPQLHGYGTQIVQDIVTKYNGCCVYDVVDGVFIANAMLALAK